MQRNFFSAFFLNILTVMPLFFVVIQKPKSTEIESLIEKPKFRLLNQTFGFLSAHPLLWEDSSHVVCKGGLAKVLRTLSEWTWMSPHTFTEYHPSSVRSLHVIKCLNIKLWWSSFISSSTVELPFAWLLFLANGLSQKWQLGRSKIMPPVQKLHLDEASSSTYVPNTVRLHTSLCSVY